jgi:hypothetical protein
LSATVRNHPLQNAECIFRSNIDGIIIPEITFEPKNPERVRYFYIEIDIDLYCRQNFQIDIILSTYFVSVAYWCTAPQEMEMNIILISLIHSSGCQ